MDAGAATEGATVAEGAPGMLVKLPKLNFGAAPGNVVVVDGTLGTGWPTAGFVVGPPKLSAGGASSHLLGIDAKAAKLNGLLEVKGLSFDMLLVPKLLMGGADFSGD